MEPEATPYVVQRVREALATDARTSELGVTVTITGSKLFLEGAVNTDEHREAVVAVARDVVPGLEVADDLDVVELDRPRAHEELR